MNQENRIISVYPRSKQPRCLLSQVKYFLLRVEAYPNFYVAADTIRILVATDSHVGYAENDPVRKNDSWRSFDEVMCMAKDQDV